MRLARTFVLLAALLSLATHAHAGPGVFLRWSNCLGDGGQQNRAFACDSNIGIDLLVSGFELDADLPQVSGNEIVFDIASAGPVLPAWWEFKNAGACRAGSGLVMSFVPPPFAVACAEWGAGLASGGILAYNIGHRGPNTARLVAAVGVSANSLQDLFAGQEYFSCSFFVGHTKTVGTGACDGCLTPVCLVMQSITVVTPGNLNNVKLQGPSNGTDSDFATWQGGGGVIAGGALGCPAATPTARTTWGEVKHLYR